VELWRAAFEANPTMYFVVDEAGDIVSVNGFGAAQLGYSVAELVGRPVLDVFMPADRAFVLDNAQKCFREPGRPRRWEARKVRKDGTMLCVRETANAVMLKDHPVLLVACEDVTERRRAEGALRESEERFRTLVQFSFDVYWETDAQHRFVRQEFDPGLTDAPTLGSELGKTRWEVPYLEPDEQAWREHRAILDAHLPFRDFELARPSSDGGKRYVSVSGLPVFDEAGNFTGYRGVGRHITERKRAEEALRQREQELRDIIETIPAMVFVADAVGRNVVYNRRWVEYCGPGAAGSVHPDDIARYKAARRHCIETGEPFEQEVRLRRFDGEYRWFLGRAVALRDPKGRILKWYGVHTDIHDRRVAEEERAAQLAEVYRARELTRHVFETSPDAMVVIGRDYRYQRVNPVYGRNWKVPPESIVGRHVSDLFGDEVFEQTIKPKLDRCFAGEQVSYAEWFENASGRFYYSVIYAPVRLGSGQPESALSIARDLTDHMLASEALRDAEAALARVNRVTTLGVLAASIAHEVNQPLGAMITSAAACARWLGAEPPEMEKARSALQRITADGRRAGQVVDRIRALVNRQAPRRSPVDVNEAILEVIALTRDEVRRNAITLDSSLAGDLPLIEGDRVQLQQVVLNLLVNAIEAMSSDTSADSDSRPRALAISSARDGADAVRVDVSDSGPGVDASQADRLFEAFHTTKQDGIGMGLSISRSIVEAHGGRLWVEPNTPHGARFVFSLPLRQPAP
jgi:PAS domain S-box-containing protein